jgi:hypothetical protein
MQAYLRAYERAYGRTGLGAAHNELVWGYRDAVEAVLQALEHGGGDRSRLLDELARLRASLVTGRVRLDGHRQAVVTARVVRIPATAGSPPQPLATAGGVEESLGGLLAPGRRPDPVAPACRRTRPPPWAR